MPTRKVPTPRPARLMAERANSSLSGELESNLRRELVSILEFDSNVHSYEEGPVEIPYIDGKGKYRSYTPDFLVSYHSNIAPACWLKPRLIEVESRSALWANWKELKPKFSAAIRFAAIHNWDFKILTEKEIRTEYLENARFFNRYRHVEVDQSYVLRIDDILRSVNQSSPQELVQILARDPYNQGQYLFVLWHMIALGFVQVELTQKLTMQSPIWIASDSVPVFLKPDRKI